MKRSRVLCLLLILCLLGGCAGVSAEELYCLPEANQDYYDLKTALSQVISEGLSYHAPSSGTQREPVQLVDLNGDGTDEAVAFFKNQDGAVVIYIFSKNGDEYETADTIECSGSTVGSVEYADLDGDGTPELLLTCQVSESVTQALQVFRFAEGEAISLLTAPCGRFLLVDLDGDGAKEVFSLTDGGADSPAAAEYYSMDGGALTSERELQLSAGYSGILDLQEGALSDGSGAIIASLDGGDQIITDVLIREEKGLRRLDAGEILRTDRIRGSILPADIDGDGAVEIPKAVTLRPNSEGTVHWAVAWYGLDREGDDALVMTTYHDFTEDWYLELPASWKDQVTIVEEGGDRAGYQAMTFRRVTDKGEMGEELLTIYTLKGADRQKEAEDQEMTILYSDADRILAVRLWESEDEGGISMAQVSERFHIGGNTENE